MRRFKKVYSRLEDWEENLKTNFSFQLPIAQLPISVAGALSGGQGGVDFARELRDLKGGEAVRGSELAGAAAVGCGQRGGGVS